MPNHFPFFCFLICEYDLYFREHPHNPSAGTFSPQDTNSVSVKLIQISVSCSR